ncbi:peptidoglycan D,D-transpeptidase FtsI family protein [Solicola gregarius]|uniref:Penicillin-binding protein 2 n=1 Tax=Solicola gregarius TaxID=2908642 RepID=A0AA46TI98_9ACTN|nr:penicillin-binding protein 2 [Solicola gregarius]UYM05359.1 penicillin-binding protein 2 [Solicola gregarius]
MIAFLLSLFAARLFQLQGVDANAYAAKAAEEGTQKIALHAERGEILDRDGEALATSIDAWAITADPTMTDDDAPKIAAILARKLDLDYFTLVEKLRQADTQFVYLAHQVPTWKADKAIEAVESAGFTGVFRNEREPLRTYPGGTLAANTLGIVNADGLGGAGLEREYDSELAGEDGEATYEVSPSGERIPLADSTVKEPEPGTDVVTTIDRDLQWYAQQRLQQAVHETSSDWGVVIVKDVKTGEVLALSQLPTFDANDPGSITPDNMNARAVQNVYEPGSVQKVITMAALADQGLVNPRTKVRVPGSMTLDGFTIGDYWGHGTLNLTAAGIIGLSSNMGTVTLSQQMNDKNMHSYLEDFGFGEPTGIGLPGESGGILADPDDWSRAKHATISFGQGISVTAMQEASAIEAIANGGVYNEPSLVSGYVDSDGDETQAPEPDSHRVVSKDAADDVTRMMEAVTSPGGTATQTKIAGYRTAGKTGTAWRVDPETGSYVRGQNTVSFAGFAPADDPRFLTYVVLDNPAGGGSGSGDAGPVFHDVMRAALERYGVPPTGERSPRTPLYW